MNFSIYQVYYFLDLNRDNAFTISQLAQFLDMSIIEVSLCVVNLYIRHIVQITIYQHKLWVIIRKRG